MFSKARRRRLSPAHPSERKLLAGAPSAEICSNSSGSKTPPDGDVAIAKQA
jgi:hypothetical protein